MLNKKIFASLLACSCIVASNTKAQLYSPAHLIYTYASSSNIVGAKRISDKYGIDMMDVRGDTALCHSMKQKDAKTYKILMSMGAKSNDYCLAKNPKFKKVLAEYDATTRGAYHNSGTLLSRPRTITPEVGISTSAKVGWTLGGIALVGGGIAAAAGGGGGGSSSSSSSSGGELSCEEQGGTLVNGECIISGEKGAAPRNEDPEKFHTQEYTKTTHLSSINADKAYARGYTGYIINRNEDGTLISDGSELISTEKLKVGVLDAAFDINHPDLLDNVVKDADGKVYGYNFDYGPCRNGDTTHCYGIEDNMIVFYGDGEILAQSTPDYTEDFFNLLFQDYPADYDWDKIKNNPISYYLSEQRYSELTNTTSGDHGTHVMGIIGALADGKGMQGVAPNVEMVAISYNQPLISFPNVTDSVYTSALNALLAENAKVVNMSFGVETNSNANTQASYAIGKSAYDIDTQDGFDDLIPMFEGLAANNVVIVKAAGNEGEETRYEADIISGLPLSDTFKAGSEYDLTNLFMTVVSTNSNNELAYYSQKCGATQNYCIAAPGGDAYNGDLIYSTVQNDDKHTKDEHGNAYGYMQGTSMAAPVVTGSVALLMGAYPHLTPQQIVQILFETATDLGDEGVDEIFGHGLLNLDAATSPIGYLEFDFVNDNQNSPETFSASALKLSKSATAKILAVLPKKFTVFDKYNRSFEISSSKLFADTSKQQRHLFENEFKAFMSKGKQTIMANNSLSFAFNTSATGNDIYSPFGYLSMDYKADKQLSFNAFYSENTILNSGEIFTRTAQNPFISMDNAFGVGFNYELGSKANVKFDYTIGKNNFYEDLDNSDLYDNRMDAFNSELNYDFSKFVKMSGNFGLLREDGSVLGMIGSNAFDFDDSQTYFGGIKLSYMPTAKMSITAAYTRGYTNTAVNNRLFSMSDIESESVSLNATYFLSKESNIGLDIYSPLRIINGTADIMLANGRHPTEDKVYMNKYQTSLKDKAREWDFSMFYNTKIKDDANFKTRFGIRINPEHEQNAKPDYFGMFNLNFAF